MGTTQVPMEDYKFRVIFHICHYNFWRSWYLVAIFQKSSIQLYHVADNMMTYSIALSIPACITIILQYFPKAENQVSLIISIISLLLIEVVVIVLFVVINSDWKFHIAVLGIVLSWIFWTIANSDNKYLDDKSYRQTIKDDLEKHGKDWN